MTARREGDRRRAAWELWRPPLVGLAGVLLVSLGAAALIGQRDVWRTTVEGAGAQDFGIFYTSIQHYAHGRSLYAPQPPPSGFPYRTGQLNLNLPHTNVFFLPLALLSPRAGFVVWVAASLFVFICSTWRSLRALAWRLPPLAWLALAVYLVAWGPAAAFSLTFQLSFLLMGPVTAAWLAARQGRSRTAGAWLGLAAIIKPFLLLFVPFLLLRRDRRALEALAAVGVGMIAIGVLVFGPGAYRDWLVQLPRVTWGSHYMNASVAGLLQRLLGRSTYEHAGDLPWLRVLLLAAAVATVGTVTIVRTARLRKDAAGVDAAWASLLLASILLSPLGWVYYVWVALWPVAAVIGHERPWARRTSRDLLLVPGLGGWLWFRKMAAWGQPSLIASATFASMYFWALATLWWWCLGTSPIDTTPGWTDTGTDRPA